MKPPRFLRFALFAILAAASISPSAQTANVQADTGWEDVARRLEGVPRPQTEQTLVHLAVQQAGGRPLPPARYVLQSDDGSTLREPLVGPDVVLRHYTGPVRHKLWLRVARRKFSPRRVVSSG